MLRRFPASVRSGVVKTFRWQTLPISNSEPNPYTSPNATVGISSLGPPSKTRFWVFASLWTFGTFLYSIIPFADELLGLGLSGNSIGYGLIASVILVFVSLIVAQFRIGYRLLAFLLFVILIPVQMIVTAILLVIFFGMDGVQ